MVLQRDDHRGQTLLSHLVFGADDVSYLRSSPGASALAAVAELGLTDATRIADVAAVRARFGEKAAVLVETTLLRRRAFDQPGKLGPLGRQVSQWLFTGEALQQATAAPVALHRAARLAAGPDGPDVVVHDATCSVGTELAALHGAGVRALGSDIDPVRLAMAHHNVGATAVLCRADALHPVTRDTVVLVDPARRHGGRRRLNPDDYRPALGRLIDLYRGRHLVVKCGPGMDFGMLRRCGFDGEIEVTSYRGSVREACLWSAGLAEPGVRRRASILDGASPGEQISDIEPEDCGVRPHGRWIVDPDGAVVRAGLVRHYGTRHGLWQLDPDIAYLSGDRLPPGVRGFEVLDEVAFDERRLRQVLAARDCGAVEILARGVRLDPDALRRRLRLRGDQPLSVVVTRIGAGAAGRATAFVCRPSR
ncbi:THUMP-like domain-containing protein [Mycobacterium sp. THU-M104]|uniref:THUMP-like domain-containing protein n=1 Tax=Mycobacterium sp. THU-M104 TaxID=3410515 RepID=UPI003B999A1A